MRFLKKNLETNNIYTFSNNHTINNDCIHFKPYANTEIHYREISV